MPRCAGCDRDFDVDELTRHEREGVVHVHCPECGRHLGDYNEHTSP